MFAPGRVTYHRITGAVLLYLTIGQIFVGLYGMVDLLAPHSLSGVNQYGFLLGGVALGAHSPSRVYAPRYHACIHEAGHCVIYMIDDLGVVSCRICSRWHLDRQTWGGVSTPPTASPIADDILVMRTHLAGALAEVCFLPDVRPGSSLDEIVLGQLLAENLGF